MNVRVGESFGVLFVYTRYSYLYLTAINLNL